MPRPATTSSPLQECDPAEAHKYGIVGRGEDTHPVSRSPAWWRSRRRTAPPTSTSMAATSCSRRSSGSARARRRGAGNEIQLTDAMLKLEHRQPFYGYHYRAAPSTAARRRASSRPMSPSRCGVRTCTRRSSGVIRRLLDEMQPPGAARLCRKSLPSAATPQRSKQRFATASLQKCRHTADFNVVHVCSSQDEDAVAV